jgi:hypothetical protein
MLRNSLFLIAFVCALVVLLYACKKEEDTVAPFVNISSPFENQAFAVHDTMSVSATVSDETLLESAYVILVDENLVPVQPAVQVKVDNNEEKFTLKYVIYDIHLASGTYYVKVSAFDGYNTTNSYRKVSVTAAPRERKGFYLVSGSQSSLTVSLADDALTITPKLTLSGDYAASSINSYYQDLYVSGKYSGGMNAVSLQNNSLKWNLPVVQGTVPYFTNVYNDGNYSYVSYYSGHLRGYDHNGTLKYTVTAAENFFPDNTYHHGEYIISEQHDKTSPVRKLAVYYASNGTGKQETSVLFQDVIAFHSKDPDNIFVFGNSGSQGDISIYSMSGNSFWSPYGLPSGRLLSVAQVDNNTYLLAHENQVVYKFQYNPLGLIPLITGVKATSIQYDPVMSQVVTSGDNNLRLYNYQNGAMINSVLYSDTIRGVHVWYNK